MFGRSRLVTAGAAIALCCLGSGIAVATTVRAPWAESDHDAARSRYNSAESTLGPSNVASARYLRSLTAAPANSPWGVCGPGAARTLLTAGRVFFVGNSGVHAYNAATGRQIWRAGSDQADSTHYVDIAAWNGRIFVGEDDCGSNSDPNGGIEVYDASTGAPVWSASFGTALSGLVVTGNYVVADGASIGSGAKVAVYDAATGATVWSKDISNSCDYLPTVLVVRGEVIQECDDNGDLATEAADLATGTVRWTKAGNWNPLRGDSDASTAHHLYARSPTHAITDINPATGAARFTLAGATDVLAVGPVRVFTSCSAGICAYSTATGAPSWSAAGSGPVALANGVLYTGDGRALNATTGAQLATLFTGHASQLMVGDGRLGVVTDDDGRIVDLYGLAGD